MKRGVPLLITFIVGWVLIIAYFLSAGGDTITVLQAVLDTQFWLALHVTCITLGYASTYFAGLFGVLYVVFGFATPMLEPVTDTIGPIPPSVIETLAPVTDAITPLVEIWEPPVAAVSWRA